MRGWKLAVLAITVLVLAPLALIILGAAAVSGQPSWACTTTAPSPGSFSAQGSWAAEGSWDATQVTNAAIIVQVGAERQVPQYGWTIAVATAMQESSLNNLDHGADDSLGLFQQRPSQGWGTPAQLQDPRYASMIFYDRLVNVDGWQNMALTVAAQAVQRSAYPNAYAKWQSDAEHLVELIRTRLGITCAAGGTGEWRAPLPKGAYSVGSPYGPRGGRIHRGVDLIAAFGTPIFAASAGKVTYVGCNSPFCDRPGEVDSNGAGRTPGCGLMIEIQHAGGIGTTYCHASAAFVTNGQQVGAGERIAQVGSTGHSSGNHLHYQVHRPAPPITNTTAVDPMPFMTSVGADL